MKTLNAKPKIIFLTGGVCSSVGKGVAISSVAIYLKELGYKVKVKKCDPYLNIDPGTLSPFQHGEVFVTADGVETDLDIGHYERFTDQATKETDYITSGKVYYAILNRERAGGYEGKTVQVIPHVIDQIKQMILSQTDDLDYLLCEIGGTVGDLEASPYYETIRQLRFTHSIALIHVAYMPYLSSAQEIKTKPIQHSLKELLSLGLSPDIVICRTEHAPESDDWKSKIASYANLDKNRVILGQNVDNTYQMLGMYNDNGLLEQISNTLNIEYKHTQVLDEYKKLQNIAQTASSKIKIGIVGKYINLQDSYKSLQEALFYSACLNDRKLDLVWIDAENQTELDQDLDGIVIPGGFGLRGIDGMIKSVECARKRNLPCLGICLGMQVMAVEAARNLANITDACSAEWGAGTHIIDLIDKVLPENNERTQATITNSIRTGEYTSCVSGKMQQIYNAKEIRERFRHRYEFNKQYQALLEEKGVSFVGFTYIGAKEARFTDCISYDANTFHIGVQFHPEFTAKPLTGHPLFNAFIATCAFKDYLKY